MIQFEKVTKQYELGGEIVKAIDNVSLKINNGEFVGILGSSGSGKSTLMHMIGLLDNPSSGKIFIGNKDVSTLNDDEISKIRSEYIGFVFQQFNLVNQLSVLENVILPTVYSKKKLDFDPEQRATELLTRFGLFDRRNFFPNKISGGQQQRVAIARSLIMKPEILLADEPTGNLDSKTGSEILSLLNDLNKDTGVTVIIVTHDQSVAKKTKRQIFIKDGKVVSKYS
jgi:ABC-type lipoprotein export system ATPase subunit